MSSLNFRSKWMFMVIDSMSTYDSWEHFPIRRIHRSTVSSFFYLESVNGKGYNFGAYLEIISGKTELTLTPPKKISSSYFFFIQQETLDLKNRAKTEF